MTTKTVMTVSAVIETVTGLVLIFNPGLAARVLLGADLSASGVAVGRLCGIGLLSLGLGVLAKWSERPITFRSVAGRIQSAGGPVSWLSQSRRRLCRLPAMAGKSPPCRAGAVTGTSSMAEIPVEWLDTAGQSILRYLSQATVPKGLLVVVNL